MLGMICTCTATYPLVYPVLRSDKTLRQDLSKLLARALDGCPPEQFFGISALNIGPEFIQLMGAVQVLVTNTTCGRYSREALSCPSKVVRFRAQGWWT